MNFLSLVVLGVALAGLSLVVVGTFNHKYDYSRPLLQQSFEQEQVDISDIKNLKGIIVSLQYNGSTAPAWMMTGRWAVVDIPVNNSNTTSQNIKFTSNLTMSSLDGLNNHKHKLVDFKLSNMTFLNRTATLTGTVDMTTSGEEIGGYSKERIRNIPVVIKIMNIGMISIELDKNLTKDHFGETPIYGKVNLN